MQMKYLIISNLLIWLGIGGYLIFLAIKAKRLEKKVKQLELLNNE
jgi:CcmD family protein